MRVVFITLLLLFLPHVALAATISGTVYDFNLDQVDSAVVSITTQPEQRIVAKNGTYSFSVPEGGYVLLARAKIEGEEWDTSENITVIGDGVYALDLILEPSFSDVDSLAPDNEELPSLDVTIPASQVSSSSALGVMIALGIVLVVVALVGVVVMLRRQNKSRAHGASHADVSKTNASVQIDDEFVTAVISAMRKHDGRITQRDLRKEVPFSEAKVSLVLTQLESEGKIQKIKKGRGNVLVLK